MYATALNEISAENGLVFTLKNKPENHNICIRINGWPIWVKELINPKMLNCSNIREL